MVLDCSDGHTLCVSDGGRQGKGSCGVGVDLQLWGLCGEFGESLSCLLSFDLRALLMYGDVNRLRS